MTVSDPFDDFRAYWSLQCRLGGGESEEAPTWRMSAPSPAFVSNGILRFGRPASEVAAELDALKGKGRPFTWYVMPDEDPEVTAALRATDLEEMPGFTAVQRDIGDLPPASVEPVDEANMGAYVDILMTVHQIPAAQRRPFERAVTAALEHPDISQALLRRGDDAIATGTLHTGRGVAGLYAGAVAPEARRQGAATQLLNGLLSMARAKGIQRAVGATTTDGLALCRALDFEEVGHIQQFVWWG